MFVLKRKRQRRLRISMLRLFPPRLVRAGRRNNCQSVFWWSPVITRGGASFKIVSWGGDLFSCRGRNGNKLSVTHASSFARASPSVSHLSLSVKRWMGRSGSSAILAWPVWSSNRLWTCETLSLVEFLCRTMVSGISRNGSSEKSERLQ